LGASSNGSVSSAKGATAALVNVSWGGSGAAPAVPTHRAAAARKTVVFMSLEWHFMLKFL
jgi:hypothetical protein